MTRPNSKPLAIVGPYELIERIGAGGMGSVYRARNNRDGRVVALKLMHEHVASDPSYTERFRREAAMAALIDSPNVVRGLEFASDKGRPYIVTEYIEGEGLDERIARGPLTPGEASAVATGVANALVAASRRSIVHRDIKPANILIALDGTPKVTDFGIATLSHGSSLTVPGMFVGTAAYAAPEQHLGQADVRSDIYSLGVVLFEMLTGTLPFAAETATGMMREHEQTPVPLARLAGQESGLAQVVARCLEKSRERRYQHPDQVVDALASRLLTQAIGPARLGATVVASVPPELGSPETVFAAAIHVVVSADPAATRVEAAMFETGEHPLLVAAPLGELKAKFNSTPLLRKALGAGAAVAFITLVAMFGFGGGHAEELPTGGTGSISNHQLTGAGNETPIPSVTPTATATAAPKKPRPDVTETATASPTLPAVPTKTPTPAPTVVPTKPAPPPPAPEPALAVIDWAFCHVDRCPYGDDDLFAGYPIAISFRLSQPISAPVSVKIWFDGEYQYTSNFSASVNGTYFDLLPYANYPGELEVDVYVGGEFLDSLYAFVN